MPDINIPSGQITLPAPADVNAGPPAPTTTVLVGPDKQLYNVDNNALSQQGVAPGWRKATPQEQSTGQYDPQEDAIQKRVAEMEDPANNSHFHFGEEDKALLNDLTGGAYNLRLPPEQRAIEEEARRRADEQSPVLSTIRKVEGFLAPLAIPGVGEAGEAAETAVRGAKLGEEAFQAGSDISLARKVAGSAAKYATESAIYSTPQASVQLAYGDPETAAETMLWGIGAGGILGAGGELLGAGAKGLVKGAGEAVSEAAGKAKNFAIDKLDGLGFKEQGPVAAEAANEFQQQVVNSIPDIISPGNEGNLAFANKIQKLISDGGTDPSFSFFKKTRDKLNDLAEGTESKVEQNIAGLADNVLQSHLNKKINQLFVNGEIPDKLADYLTDRAVDAAGAAGGAAGFAVGAHIPIPGAPFVAGLLGRNVTRFAANSLLRNDQGLNIVAPYLKKALTDPQSLPIIGGLFAKEGVSALQAHLDNIPAYLSGSKVVARTVAASNPAQYLLGSTTGLSKEQQYNKLTQAIRQASIDTGLTAQKIGNTASVFAGTSNTLANLIAQKKFAAIAYLQSQIPTNPNPARPFQKNDWQPSKQQQSEFLQKVAVVNNPMVAWQHFQEGGMTRIDRDTMQAVYPKIYGQMVDKIMTSAYDPRNKSLGYADRINMSMFTGQNLDASLKNIGALQQSLASPQTPPTMPAPSKKSGHRASRAPKFDRMPSLETESQRRTYER